MSSEESEVSGKEPNHVCRPCQSALLLRDKVHAILGTFLKLGSKLDLSKVDAQVASELRVGDDDDRYVVHCYTRLLKAEAMAVQNQHSMVLELLDDLAIHALPMINDEVWFYRISTDCMERLQLHEEKIAFDLTVLSQYDRWPPTDTFFAMRTHFDACTYLNRPFSRELIPTFRQMAVRLGIPTMNDKEMFHSIPKLLFEIEQSKQQYHRLVRQIRACTDRNAVETFVSVANSIRVMFFREHALRIIADRLAALAA